VQPLVHLDEELVEVHAALAAARRLGEEAVHQHRLARPHAAPQVQAARRGGLRRRLRQRRPLLLSLLLRLRLQGRGRRRLRAGIGGAARLVLRRQAGRLVAPGRQLREVGPARVAVGLQPAVDPLQLDSRRQLPQVVPQIAG